MNRDMFKYRNCNTVYIRYYNHYLKAEILDMFHINLIRCYRVMFRFKDKIHVKVMKEKKIIDLLGIMLKDLYEKEEYKELC